MLNTKEIELISFLIEQPSSLSITQIAEHFSLGERSIRYYITSINAYLKEPAIHIHKGTCSIKQKQTLLATLSASDVVLASTDIQKMIIRYSLIFKETINLTSISEQLQISRSSAKAYFDEIKQNFPASYTFDVKQKKGITLQYNEAELRKLQVQTWIEFLSLDTYKQQILQPYVPSYDRQDHINIIDQFLSAIQKDMDSILSDQAYLIVKHYILITIKRIKLQKNLFHDATFEFLYDYKEYQIIKKHLPFLEHHFSLSLHDDERLQLCDLFIGSHYSSSDNLNANTWFEYELFVAKIINMFSELYKIQLHQDYVLYQSLLTHIKPTLYRLQNNIKVQEIDCDAIHKQFSKVYETTRIVLNKLHFFTNLQEDSSEIALLTLHFQAAIDRYQNRFAKQANILIVCSHGYGTSQLLKQQLLDAYEVHVIDCIPVHFLSSFKDLHQIDFIITTIPNLSNKKSIACVQVAPVLSEKDFDKLNPLLLPKQQNRMFLSSLMNVVKEQCFIKDEKFLEEQLLHRFPNQIINDVDHQSSSLLHILPLQNIAYKPNIHTWEEAVELGGKLLEANQSCTKDYTERLLASFENYGDYMIIADGVAIPHARNDNNVMQTGMSLIILDTPVVFHDNKQLSIFFSFCSKDNVEHIDALVAIANLIKESNFRQELKNFQNAIDVLRYIYDFVSA